MKRFVLLALILVVLMSKNAFGQSPKAIEADLLKSFKKIGYWNENKGDNASDSLEAANYLFENKLLYATTKYPFTISLPFKSFDQEVLGITTSSDGALRIYYWDSFMGGTQHTYFSIAQYRTEQNVKSAQPASPNEYTCYYSKIYPLKNNGKVYYLAVYDEVLDLHDYCQGIQIFSIENGRLIPAKLIKTPTGLHSKIDYLYNDNSMRDQDWANDLKYDEKTQTLAIPVVLEGGSVTDKFITYKFNGQYFIKAKSK